MGANRIIGADTEALTANGVKLKTFADDLKTNLTSLKNNIDEAGAEGIFGTSANKLLEVYNALNTDLENYAKTIDLLSVNVKGSSNNKVNLDAAEASRLIYEG